MSESGIFNNGGRGLAKGIPQVAVLTKVDEMCPWVAEDTKLVYRSKKVKEKMQECSNRLGIPLNCIFPVKNYHEEIHLNNDVDMLLLSALNLILNFANDHVAEKAPSSANMRNSTLGQHKDSRHSEPYSILQHMNSRHNSMDFNETFREDECQYSLHELDSEDCSMGTDINFSDVASGNKHL